MLPIRQATRLINEFQARGSSIGMKASGLDMTRSLTLLAMLRAALREPAVARVSVNRIATSLKQPVETLRRAALSLADAGFCERMDRGVQRVPEFLRLPAITTASGDLLAAFDIMVNGLEGLGLGATSPAQHEQSISRTLAAALDIYLSAFELSESRICKPLTLYVLGVITVRNAGQITHNPILSVRYGSEKTVPPDILRCPVNVFEIADQDGLPATTLWRHVKALERSGAIRRVTGGYLLADVYLRDPGTSERSREKVAYVRRVLKDLACDDRPLCA